MEEIQTVVYKAIDGEIFTDKAKCKEHEQGLKLECVAIRAAYTLKQYCLTRERCSECVFGRNLSHCCDLNADGCSEWRLPSLERYHLDKEDNP